MSAAGAALSVAIAEDAAIMRDGLTQTLTRRGLDVVAAVADADALRQAVENNGREADITLPGGGAGEGRRPGSP